MDFELRPATAADLGPIMTLEIASFADDAWSPESMESELASEHTHYLVAFDPAHPSELAGYAGLLAPQGARDADIQTIAVSSAARRNGLGRYLMESLIAEADARGMTQVFLEVRADNPNARALYDSLGFELLAVRKGYYQPGNVDADVMRLTIVAGADEAADDEEVES